MSQHGVPNYLAAPTANTAFDPQTDIMSQLLNLGGNRQQGAGGFSMNPQPEGGGFNLAGLGSAGQGIAGLMSAWAGLQAVKQGKKQLSFQKDLTNRNLSNQATTTNAELGDRQQRRISAAGSGGGYQSVADYMQKNRVNGGAL